MRVMMIVKASSESETGAMPTAEQLKEMHAFNEQLIDAGVLLAGEGLHASSRGARIRYSGDKRTVIDGPFTETKELIAGFWILKVKSRDEAIAWAKKVPFRDGEVEIRPVVESEDFGDALPPEVKATEEKWRKQGGYAER